MEEEYDEDGILVYSPPPLDEVWLSEPECQECHQALEKQCNTQRRHRECEIEEIHRCLKKSHDSLPPLVDSDVDSDSDCDFLSSGPVIKSGGDDSDHDESYWKDHPLHNKDEPELPTFEQIDSPSKSPEEVEETNSLGRSADGKSRRLHQLVSMGTKQVPPSVRRAFHLRCTSRKREQYKQHIAKHCHKADELMLRSEIEVPTVEALMACPLSKFIHLQLTTVVTQDLVMI